jgi:hypothetical protein
MAVSPALPGAGLELAKSTEHPFEQVKIRTAVRVIELMHPDESLHRHISDKHTRHAQRHPEHGRYLRD